MDRGREEREGEGGRGREREEESNLIIIESSRTFESISLHSLSPVAPVQ